MDIEGKGVPVEFEDYFAILGRAEVRIKDSRVKKRRMVLPRSIHTTCR
jgi:hypothetical protein